MPAKFYSVHQGHCPVSDYQRGLFCSGDDEPLKPIAGTDNPKAILVKNAIPCRQQHRIVSHDQNGFHCRSIIVPESIVPVRRPE
jgi:hypothetical protein